MTPMVMMTPDELTTLIRQTVREEMHATRPESSSNRLLTRGEAAEYLRCSVQTLDRLSDIPFQRVASKKVFRLSDLDAYGRTDRAKALNDKLSQLNRRRK